MLNDAEMSKFRSAVGMLLYLAADLLSALHSFSGKQDDVSNPALLAIVETFGVIIGGKSRCLFGPLLQVATERSAS